MSELEQRIRRIFLDSRRLYGSRKFKEVLEQQRVYVTGKTVEDAS
ncbi:IS3 family transposase [Paenibacillus polymyxa]